MEQKKKHKFRHWLTRQYQLVIYRDGNFDILKKLHATRLMFLLIAFSIVVILFAAMSLLIVFTPIKHLVPGYPDERTFALIHQNAIRVDSLAKELEARDKYLCMIRDVIFEEVPIDANFAVPVANLSEEQIRSFNDPSQPRQHFVDSTDNANIVNKTDIVPNMFVPMRGSVVNAFDRYHRHLGIDIAQNTDESIFSVLPGVVVESNFTIENGYSLIIQHAKGIISIYKHCGKVLVKSGQKVRQGEQIAIYGESGDNSTGPHLHFELWQNGEALNPNDYIEF